MLPLSRIGVVTKVIDLNPTVSAPTRFDWVIDGQSRGRDPLFDTPLLGNTSGVVVPSVGSLVAGWSLVVPRTASLNFRELGQAGRANLATLRASAAAILTASFNLPVFEFEHGPELFGSLVGCGVDQAHLHQVPLPFDLLELIKRSGLAVRDLGISSDPWANIEQADYWLVRDTATGHSVVAYPSQPSSQGLRRMIAGQLGRPNAWNYRSHPMAANAQQTVDAFRNAAAGLKCP